MNAETMEGKCLCGAVTVKVKIKKDIEACHCRMCIRWGSGPLMAIPCDTDIEISGNEHISKFDSSEWAERTFCMLCGTHLFYRLKSTNEHLVLAGLFQNQEGFEIKEQVFIDKKPPYYALANKTPALTDAEVFQKYGVE